MFSYIYIALPIELLDFVCSAYDLQPRGSAGEHSAAVGAKFDVSNKQRLGFSEVELVQKMIDGVSEVIEYEEMLANGVSTEVIRNKVLASVSLRLANSRDGAIVSSRTLTKPQSHRNLENGEYCYHD